MSLHGSLSSGLSHFMVHYFVVCVTSWFSQVTTHNKHYFGTVGMESVPKLHHRLRNTENGFRLLKTFCGCERMSVCDFVLVWKCRYTCFCYEQEDTSSSCGKRSRNPSSNSSCSVKIVINRNRSAGAKNPKPLIRIYR